MPIYEYSCPNCGPFEHFQKLTDPHLETCPTCGKPVKKLIGRNVGIVFRAGGYYASDHRSSDYKQKMNEDLGKSSPPITPPSESKANPPESKAKAAAE